MIVQKFPKLLLDFPCTHHRIHIYPHTSFQLPSHFQTFSLTHNHPFAFNFPTSTTQSPHNFALLRSRFSKKANLSYTQQQQHMKQTSLSRLFIYVHFSVTMTTTNPNENEVEYRGRMRHAKISDFKN